MTYQLATSKRRLVKPVPVATAPPSLGQRLLAIDAIVDVIFSFSTPRTIISLSKTCRAVGPIVASYFRVAYNPEYFLRQFLPDPPVARAFRTLQAETGVIIFGKAAFNFFARAPFTETAMSLYVDGSYASQVNDFLTNAGYDVETHEGEFVFFKEGENGQVIYKIVLQVGGLDSPGQFQNVSTSAWRANHDATGD
jgi:DNA-dependent RNA polymerase auxiliary subunit epsilon